MPSTSESNWGNKNVTYYLWERERKNERGRKKKGIIEIKGKKMKKKIVKKEKKWKRPLSLQKTKKKMKQKN